MFQKFKRLATVITLLSLLAFFSPTIASAASLTAISDTMSRLKVSTASNHTIKFTTPTGIVNTNTITLTFPSSSFTMGASLTGVTIADGVGADNAVTSATYAANVLTITASASSIVAAGHVATIKIPTTQITNPSTAATYIVTIGGTFGDSGKLAVAILSDDQFSVTATVDPTMTFALNDTTTAFGTLSSSSVTTAGTAIDLTISTNAQSGYTIKVQDAGSGSNPGLYNTNATFLIGSANYSYGPSADLASVAGYGIQGLSTDATVASPYNVSGTNVGGYQLTAQNLATYSGVASSHVVTITSKAKITGATPAGAYSDTVTVTATSNF